MQEFERLVTESPSWVHAALFAYAFIKTGPLPIFAGYASTLGWIDALSAFAAVWTGAVSGDLLRFELARRWGPAVLRRTPTWQRRTSALAGVLARNDLWVCLLKRFAKGLRTPISLACGLSTLSRVRFACVTIVTAAVWAGSFVGLGIVAGAVVDQASGPWIALGGLALMAGMVTTLTWLVHRDVRSRGVVA